MLTYQGWSGIFAFPYRIQANEPLAALQVDGDVLKYRIYPPFLRRIGRGPITDDVPVNLWPHFRWHPEAPPEWKNQLLAPLNINYENAIVYDGLRVDVIGTEQSDPMLPFVQRSMHWVRLLSGQPWIGDLDHHFEATLKRVFMIQVDGTAAGQLHPVAQMVAITTIRLVTNDLWRAAFEVAAQNKEVPVYWNLLFDAMNAAASHDYARAVMNLAMALESSRDQNFSKVHPSKHVEGRGPKLLRPFDHDDLLKHLSDNSERAFKRNFAKEMPEHWKNLKNLYVARHHVAHGGAPAYHDASGMVLVDQKGFDPLRRATRAAVIWMEAISKNAVHPMLMPDEPQTAKVALSTG